MLLSYLKIAWKVLLRRKFFTFISLFGISFTLMILLVVTAFIDHAVGPQTPEKRSSQMLFVTLVQQEFRDGGTMNSPLSPHFIDQYIRTMKTPAMVGLSSISSSATAFAGNQTLTLDVHHTDGNFWKMMDFRFLDGRAYTADEVRRADRVCVINEHTARAFFGTTRGVAGRQIEVGPHRYRVAGVVPDVPTIRLISSADVWLPYTHSNANYADSRLEGEFIAVLLAPTEAAVPAMRAEFRQMMRRVQPRDPKQIKTVYAYADPLLANFTRQFTKQRTHEADGVAEFVLGCTVLALLFMLLPALNLVNLNVTRILERSSEIGVRKAFGASGRALVGQFLVENLVLAGVGGLLGLALAAGTLRLLNDSHLIAYAQFGLSWTVFGWALLLALVFGLMSGVYPAWKMSRLNPVDALRGSGGGLQ